MIRKPTRPKMVIMPRRDPTVQLPSKCPVTTPRPILKKPKRTGQTPLTKTPLKRVRFTASEVLPSRVFISSYANDAYSILRDILAEKKSDPAASKLYKLQSYPAPTPPDELQAKPALTPDNEERLRPSPTPTLCHELQAKPGDEGRLQPSPASTHWEHQQQITVISREKQRVKPPSAFPGNNIHRLWKLDPGLYRLIDYKEDAREALLRVRKTVVRTPLPASVPKPPEITERTYLEIGAPRNEQRNQRVSVRWVSV